jgi:diguanylate cyclase
MALEYKSKIGLDVIMPVLDEYVVWYGKIVRAYFEGKPTRETPPAVFNDWLAGAGLPENVADKARGIHQGMIDAANMFITKFASRENPPLTEYNDFSRYYEEFIQFMRRLEFDHATENSIFDEKTGLRSPKFMSDDIAREMERRARRGNPFSLALVKINNFKDEWRGNESACRPMVLKISEKLKECLRSFDDAYYLGDEYFLLSLKHADLLGSQAALARLNGLIAAAHIPAPDSGEISVSSVLSEPTPGDKLDDLLANMKKDLQGIEVKGTVLQYQDLSPIQRYIHSIEKGK